MGWTDGHDVREREKSSRRYCSNIGTAANESSLEIVPLPSGIHDERTAKSSKQQLVQIKSPFQITKLKIASNPFAKGFREATRTR